MTKDSMGAAFVLWSAIIFLLFFMNYTNIFFWADIQPLQ